METMLNIGATLDEKTSKNASNAIEQILKAAFDYRVADKVVLKSLEVLQSAVTVSHVNIEHCHFDNDTSKTIEINVPEDFNSK